MSVVTIHQPNYLPWIGFFAKMAQADVCVMLDCVQYAKGSVTNRNLVLGPQGPLLLTVPVSHRFGATVAEVELPAGRRWAEKHYRTLETCYRRAPFWREHEPFLRSVYLEREWRLLAELNEAIIRYLFAYLGIGAPLVRASTLGASGAGTELLVDLTRRAGGRTYLSGPSGRNYLAEDRFAEAGLRLEYFAFEHPVYDQGGRSAFVSHLSALDLVMHQGPASGAFVAGGRAAEAARA